MVPNHTLDDCSACVQDIWCEREGSSRHLDRQALSKETWLLDAPRSLPLKKMGRPVGRQDTKPRKSRIVPRKLESTKLGDATDVASSHLIRHHDKSVDEQLHEWYLRCVVDCDFQDPFASDLADSI